MSKIGKKGKIEKKLSKKIDDLGNMSKIGKMRQDCVTDPKQAGADASLLATYNNQEFTTTVLGCRWQVTS